MRELYRRQWSYLTTSDEVNDAAKKLEEYGWVRVEHIPTGGRDSKVLRVHPALRREPSDPSQRTA